MKLRVFQAFNILIFFLFFLICKESSFAMLAEENISSSSSPFIRTHLKTVGSIYWHAVKDVRTSSLNLKLFTADEQTAGRENLSGQRKWISPPNLNIYAAYCFPWYTKEGSGSLFPLIAISIARVLERYGLVPQFKWPNDILLSGKKVCGFSGVTSVQCTKEEHTFLCVNIGLNVNMGGDILSTIDQPATSMAFESQKIYNTEEVLNKISQNLLYSIARFNKERSYPNEWIAYYNQRLVNKGPTGLVELDKSGCALMRKQNGELYLSGDGFRKEKATEGEFINNLPTQVYQALYSVSIQPSFPIELQQNTPLSTPIHTPPSIPSVTPVHQEVSSKDQGFTVVEPQAKVLISPEEQGKIKISITYPAESTGMQVLTWEISKEALDKANSAGLGEPKAGKNGKGLRWQESEKCKNGIRLMPGDHTAKWDCQKENYVHIRRDGKVIGPDQKEVMPTEEFTEPGANPISHISEKEWLKWEKPLGEEK